MTIFVAHDGTYTDNEGKLCRLSDAVFEIIGMMKLGQKVLIQEKETEGKREDGHEGVKI